MRVCALWSRDHVANSWSHLYCKSKHYTILKLKILSAFIKCWYLKCSRMTRNARVDFLVWKWGFRLFTAQVLNYITKHLFKKQFYEPSSQFRYFWSINVNPSFKYLTAAKISWEYANLFSSQFFVYSQQMHQLCILLYNITISILFRVNQT